MFNINKTGRAICKTTLGPETRNSLCCDYFVSKSIIFPKPCLKQFYYNCVLSKPISLFYQIIEFFFFLTFLALDRSIFALIILEKV